MSQKDWVPGFIWVTPRGQIMQTAADGKNEWHWQSQPPMLVAINQITDLMAYRCEPGRQDIANTCVSVAGSTNPGISVIETVEEIAELIRREWENRVSRDAEIRWSSTTGERR